MKKDSAEDSKHPATPPAPDTPAAPRKEKKVSKTKQTSPAGDIRLPVLVELTYTVSVMFFIFVGLAVISVSVLTGAGLLQLVLRASTALLAIGCLLLIIFYQVSSGVLQASLVELEEAQKAQAAEQAQKSEISETVPAVEALETQEVVEA